MTSTERSIKMSSLLLFVAYLEFIDYHDKNKIINIIYILVFHWSHEFYQK